MSDKTLKSKAINIKGKSYVQVKDRVTYFNDTFPNGSIRTKILSENNQKIVVMAKIIPDVTNPTRYFTGISASNPDKSIEKMSPYEVAETSAVGRAMALLGIGIIDSIASADEMNKVSHYDTPTTAGVNRYSQVCPIHKNTVELSKNGFLVCPNDFEGKKYHLLRDERQEEVPGQDSQFDNDKQVRVEAKQEKIYF